MFRALLAIFRWNIQLFQEATLPTTDPLFCVIRSYFYMLGKICRCLFNVCLWVVQTRTNNIAVEMLKDELEKYFTKNYV
jgi:hypothetical protein